ncbi:MAG: hypothetical protein ACKOAS_00050 [Verrucomicrobiota bacterium]
MIAEALEWCLTPCPWFARRRGILAAQIAIRHRAKRCRSSWKSHLEACRQFVACALQKSERQARLVILGSGHLNDFDLRFLRTRFDRIFLVDAVHPLDIQIHALVSKGHVGLLTADLSEPNKKIAEIVSSSDWVFSSCLLSQLGLFSASRDSRSILKQHLDLLTMARNAVFITDVAKREPGATEWVSLFENAGFLGAEIEWIWNLAPPGEQDSAGEERLVLGFQKNPPRLVFEMKSEERDAFVR